MRKTLASAGALLSVGALALTGCTPNNQNVASSASGAASSDGWQGHLQGQERRHQGQRVLRARLRRPAYRF